ncbi:hypothetical protein [Stenomitos frigidus]|uniref:Uncharacterized protein n=1 Tax=Stenomitos frigidus ULC18 TaxID=2107698 RepID=A0A2T1E098_9CYAN|nr:hypothetical protein [Stenomitos frigidus]PSB26167.1 hypothetical protein C7B82_20650 [Stenomitos frigidus ULC18]
MWLVTHPELPTVARLDPSGAPLCTINTGGNLAPLCVLDLQSQQTKPGVNHYALPNSQTIAAPPAIGNTLTLDVSTFVQVDAIQHNGRLFTPAANPHSPRAGEFVYSSHSAVLTLDPAYPLVAGLPLTILGSQGYTSQEVAISAGERGPIPSDYVDPTLFEAFFGLPVTGEITLSMSAENHPSGSFKLIATRETIADVRSRFQKGTEITLAGVGYSVTHYKDKLKNSAYAPGLEYEVHVSLGGKWERKRYRRKVFYYPAARKYLIGHDAPFQDPECGLNASGVPFSITTSNRTTVQALAAQNGVPFVGAIPTIGTSQADLAHYAISGLVPPSAAYEAIKATIDQAQQVRGVRSPVLNAWELSIPTNTAITATTDWETNARDRLRQNGCFIDFNSATAVQARDLYAVAAWSYSVVEIDVSVKGDTEFSADHFGYGMEYAASRLEGTFVESNAYQIIEETQGSPQNPPAPRWIYSPPNRRTLYSGNISADQCPSDIQTIKSMSLNYVASGRTTQLIKVEKEGNFEVLREVHTYGLEYLSTDVLDAKKNVNAQAVGFWKLVKTETTEPTIDAATNYLTGSRTIGKDRRQFRTESDQLELLDYRRTDPEWDLYQFRDFPILQLEAKVLQQFAAYYADAAKEVPPLDQRKLCRPDGTSSVQYVPDPNYTYPMFEVASRSYKNTFLKHADPNSLPAKPLPDLIQDEEQDVYRTIDILTTDTTSNSTDDQSNEGFIEYTSTGSAQGKQFSEATLTRVFADNEGRPGAATRRPNQFKKVQPDEGQTSGVSLNNAYNGGVTFEYILCTPGHSPDEPPGEPASYPRTQYLSQALLGARTELKYRDITESVDLAYAIPFNAQVRPLDKMTVKAEIDTYAVRVTVISQKVVIQGQLNGYPLCVAPDGTQITAGIDRELPFTVTKRRLPLPTPAPKPPTRPPGVGATFGLTVGDLGFDTVPSRFNF